eukprot:652936-Rhodomonas_salina.1
MLDCPLVPVRPHCCVLPPHQHRQSASLKAPGFRLGTVGKRKDAACVCVRVGEREVQGSRFHIGSFSTRFFIVWDTHHQKAVPAVSTKIRML